MYVSGKARVEGRRQRAVLRRVVFRQRRGGLFRLLATGRETRGARSPLLVGGWRWDAAGMETGTI